MRAFVVFLLFLTSSVVAQPVEPVLAQARANKTPLLDTLKELVSIESGSRDAEGLARLADLIAAKLKGLGAAKVELVEPFDVYKMEDTPDTIGKMVRATFNGKGKKKIMLIAHMDTVYPRGMLEKQPFRIDGERAYGLGISDDKQGVALILHTVAMLRALGFSDFGTLTVLINGDEEISSPGSRALLTRLGAEHDATLSFEASAASAAMAQHAQGIYRELGMTLVVDKVAEGGGTDAAFAALKTQNAVVERFGLRGFGAHSSNDEYVLISSIEPRLYLAARMIMDLSRDKVR